MIFSFDDYDYNKQYSCSPYSNCSGFSKLMYIIINDSSNNMNSFIEKFINDNPDEINKLNDRGWTVLHTLARFIKHNTDSLLPLLLIEKGVGLNIQDLYGYTALMIAVRCYSYPQNNLNILKILIEKGAILDVQNNDGYTALMLASGYSGCESNLETVNLLIDRGANLDIQCREGWTLC
jgi:ankyrin repeat protein